MTDPKKDEEFEGVRQADPRYGYMCQTDFDWELGEALGGTDVYASVKDIKRSRTCVANCGIVKVKIEFVEVVEPGTGFGQEEDD